MFFLIIVVIALQFTPEFVVNRENLKIQKNSLEKFLQDNKYTLAGILSPFQTGEVLNESIVLILYERGEVSSQVFWRSCSSTRVGRPMRMSIRVRILLFIFESNVLCPQQTQDNLFFVLRIHKKPGQTNKSSLSRRRAHSHSTATNTKVGFTSYRLNSPPQAK